MKINAGDNQPTNPNPQRSGFPLLALFFAVAAAAILLALVAPVVSLVNADEVSLAEFAGASLITGGVGMIVGFFVGLYHYRRLFGAGLGVLTGMVTGAIVGPVAVSPNYDEIMATSLGGSLLLLVLGVVCRILDQPAAK